jgi:alkylation response protein AidB-like acyl-CoA dehydrogenase
MRDLLSDRLTDAETRLRALPLGDVFDPEAPAALVAAGLHLAPVPIEAGGQGIGMLEAVDLLAALAAIDGSVGLGFAMHVHVVGSMPQSNGWPIGRREAIYGAIRDQGALINAASTEDQGGSPARGAIPGTIAVVDPDGGYTITGEKSWTTWLPALRLAIVSARISDPSAEPAEVPEVGSFVVDLGSVGVTRLPGFEALGMRGSASGRLVLDGVRIPSEALIVRRRADLPDPRGPAPGAWFQMAIAAVYLGVGEHARSEVVRWALDRRPGDGSTAVADIPSVQVRLGRLDSAVRTARIVVGDVARRWDAAAPDGRAALLGDVALAKSTATEAAVDATDEALRIAGGPGFLSGPLERAFRDARAGLINPPLEDVLLSGFARTLVERERARD